jgi:uncharacterized protein YndB with AHSA1/START domain
MTTEIGTLAVRRSVWIDASPERVWEEFQDFDRFAAWFGTVHELTAYEPHVGGRLEWRSGPNELWGGEILVYDPPHELTFEDTYLPRKSPLALLVTIRLSEHLGGTHVEFFVHGFEQLGERAGDRLRGLEGGWTTLQLNNLKKIVEERQEVT